MANTKTLTLPVRGIHCAGCAARITLALEDQPGVASATVDRIANNVTVTFDEAAATVEHLAATLAAEGYTLVVR
jgi:Cu+-exporting ATPase